MQELADELSHDQRLVLACQVALGTDRAEFCARFGWSAEKFSKVAQGARARLRALVAEYDQGERCRGLRGDLNAYVARVTSDEQANRVRRHLSNCQACAHTARELELVARGVASILPLPPTLDAEALHRFGALGRALGRLLPFWDGGRSRQRPRRGRPELPRPLAARARPAWADRSSAQAQASSVSRHCVWRERPAATSCATRLGSSAARCRASVPPSSPRMHRRDRPSRLRGAHPRPHERRPDRSHHPTAVHHVLGIAQPGWGRVARVVGSAGQQRVRLRGRLVGGLVVFDAFVVCLGACGKRRNNALAGDIVRVAWVVQHTLVHTADVEVRAGVRVRITAECWGVARWPRPGGGRPRLLSSGHPVAGGRRRGTCAPVDWLACARVHRGPPPGGVMKRPGRPSVSAAEGLDEVRGWR